MRFAADMINNLYTKIIEVTGIIYAISAISIETLCLIWQYEMSKPYKVCLSIIQFTQGSEGGKEFGRTQPQSRGQTRR